MDHPTERLYHADAGLTAFYARITGRRERDGRPAVVLDRTAFYPASSGQLPDTGTLGDAQVLDVFEVDDVIVHVVDRDLPDGAVYGMIDWPRRYDHTQQHTGQHVLSAVMIDVLGADTASFHMSEQTSTIDITRAPASPAEWDAVDAALRKVVQDNLPVTIRIAPPEQIGALNLRRTPDRSGPLRIVDIEGLDRTACGGTHCLSTGELRVIQLLSHRPRRVHGGLYRIPFVCGGRALDDYARRIAWMETLSAQLDTGTEDIPGMIENMQDRLRIAEAAVAVCEERLLDVEAGQIASEVTLSLSGMILTKVFPDRNADTVKKLARMVVEKMPCIVLFGGGAPDVQMVFARHEGLSAPHMGELMQAAARMIGGRGGGRPSMAMGGAPDMASAEKAIAWAREKIITEHGSGA